MFATNPGVLLRLRGLICRIWSGLGRQVRALRLAEIARGPSIDLADAPHQQRINLTSWHSIRTSPNVSRNAWRESAAPKHNSLRCSGYVLAAGLAGSDYPPLPPRLAASLGASLDGLAPRYSWSYPC